MSFMPIPELQIRHTLLEAPGIYISSARALNPRRGRDQESSWHYSLFFGLYTIIISGCAAQLGITDVET